MGIILHDICKSFDGQTVLKNISAELPSNGICNVTGPSGSGKTTLLRIIMGLLKTDSGYVDTDSLSFSPVFPEDRLLDSLTVLKNVSIVCRQENRARHLLKDVGLEECISQNPRELSTGMKRRVALARALAFDADVLVLDEPFKGVDQETCVVLLDIIKKYSVNRPVILVDHNQQLVRPSADFEIKLGK